MTSAYYPINAKIDIYNTIPNDVADFSLRVKVKDFEFEAHANNPDEVRSMIDDCAEKFMIGLSEGFQKKKLK